ncbi:sugar transferase [Planosporangium flavigriseum]|uniref:sugar transferase n=1 Tax=Planosporangium flavigriseum TaxID=373681 RepID=UPI00143B8606|nr:sugar transferase [Planosporangium flavigriseum]NJC65781.1 sugar transferase [Planosporangium flavigriseum]
MKTDVVVLEAVTGATDANVTAGSRRPRIGDRGRFNLVIVDILAASMAAIVIYAVRQEGIAIARNSSIIRNVLTVAMPLVWVVALALHRAYDRWSVHSVAKMWRLVVQAALTLIGAMSAVCLALRYTTLLDLILVGIPLMAALTVLMRLAAAWWLRRRDADTYLRRTLVVGHAAQLDGLLATLSRGRDHNVRVVAACVADRAGEHQAVALTVPVLGDLNGICSTALAAGCDCVIVAPCPELDAPRLRQIGWALHDAGVELLVAPALSDVAKERIAVRPAGELPLLHVRAPVFNGPQRVLKGLLDRVGAFALLLCLWPAMLVIAVLIRATSNGAALFRQRRVGRDGREFTLYKFRTMSVDAETRLGGLLSRNERADGLLFKMRADPRITRVGRFLRKYSLDELPQLINVLTGDMSLVGPRPPLPHEVARYDDTVWRRMRVKPGLTGLWQVSGRSELSWADSVRLDLSYVDNWSPALDARILLRTVSAVLKGTGAY